MYTFLFLNGQYTPVVCPFDCILCQLTTNFPLHVQALFSPHLSFFFLSFVFSLPTGKAIPKHRCLLSWEKNYGILDLNSLFNLYFYFYSSYMHWMSVYYHYAKFLSTSSLITSAWTTFCPQKLLPLHFIILSLKIFTAFPISILLYIFIALNLAVPTILEICLRLSI